jgi:uncharacterized protein YacL
MQLTIQHWLVLVLPVIVLFITFFIAEEYAIRKACQQEYMWSRHRLHAEVLLICTIGVIVAVLLGFLSYAIIFK